jgi:hypothetical protein
MNEEVLKLTKTKAKMDEVSGSEPSRSELRPSMRDEDPRERAKKRADAIRNNRSGIDLDDVDRFAIDHNMIPDGWTYEWKRHTIYGQEDPSYQVRLAAGGWEPVPANRDARHLALMPTGWKNPIIERDGMILMERPLELTEEARDVELRRARGQVRAKEQQLASTPDGTMTREHERVRPSIKKGYEPMAVPKD